MSGKRKPGKPSRPGSIVVDGERWPVHVLKVVGRDADGSPRTFELIRDDETTNVQGGEVFFTVYGCPAIAPPRRN